MFAHFIAAVLLGEEIFVCGGQADKEVINFAESFSAELQMWEPIASRMFHPRVGLGEFVLKTTTHKLVLMCAVSLGTAVFILL